MRVERLKFLKRRPKKIKKDEIEMKCDFCKGKWSLITYKELEDVLKVLEFEAEKYSINNWKKFDNSIEEYFEASMRHLLEWKNWFDKGILNVRDNESGLFSLAHAGCCLLLLLWHVKKTESLERGKGEKGNKGSE